MLHLIIAKRPWPSKNRTWYTSSFVRSSTLPLGASTYSEPHPVQNLASFQASAQAPSHFERKRVYPHHVSMWSPLLPFLSSTKTVFRFPISGHATVILHRLHSSSRRISASKSYSFFRVWWCTRMPIFFPFDQVLPRILCRSSRRRRRNHLEDRVIDEPLLEARSPQIVPHLFLVDPLPKDHPLIDRGDQP